MEIAPDDRGELVVAKSFQGIEPSDELKQAITFTVTETFAAFAFAVFASRTFASCAAASSASASACHWSIFDLRLSSFVTEIFGTRAFPSSLSA